MSAFNFKSINNFTKLISGRINESFDLTITIPTFNRIDELQNTIYSAVNQSEDNYNIIIVNNSEDDNHKTNVRELIKSYDFKHMAYFENKKNFGMFDNWNMCIGLSKTSFCTILNDDDLLYRNFVKYFRLHKDRDSLFVPRVRIIGDNKSLIYTKLKTAMYETRHFIIGSDYAESMPIDKQLKGNSVHASLGVVFNVKKAISIKGYDKDLYPAADIDFSIRYANSFGINYIFKELAAYNHGGNYSNYEVVIECAEQEYFRRKKLLKDLNIKNKYLKKIGNKINTLHFFSEVKNLSLNNSKLSQKKSIPNLFKKKRLVFLLWKCFSLILLIFKKDLI